ncbi:MAG: polymer-forming cytoskeletal protein [Anaerolineales bacterium]|jgi:hypothetical protein
MKTISKLIYLLVIITILAFPVTTLAFSSETGYLRGRQDEFVLGGTFTLASGETLSGNLWILGGNATLEPGSRVNGDIMVLGGNVSLSGEVSGDVNAMGGNIDLRSQAVVRGDLNLVGGSYERMPGARIEGRVNTAPTGPFQFTLPSGGRLPALEVRAYPLWDFVAFFFRAFVIAALAVLVVMFWPRNVERIGQTAIAQPIPAGGIGLLSAVIAPIVLLIMTITIILIPVTLIGFVILSLMVLLGWISIGMEVGQRLSVSLKQDWATPVSAGVGTLIFTIVAGGVGEVVPCVGWVVPTLLGMLGFGAVLLTRFGTQPYPGPALPPLPVAPVGPHPQVPSAPVPSVSPVEETPVTDQLEPAPWETEPDENEDETSTGAEPDIEKES